MSSHLTVSKQISAQAQGPKMNKRLPQVSLGFDLQSFSDHIRH